MERNFLKGALATLAGGTLWGFSGMCIQYLTLSCAFPSLMLTWVRMLGAGVLFLVVLLAGKRDIVRRILRDRESLVQLLVFGCVGLLFCQLLYIVTISYTNAGTATVLASFSIVICMAVTCVVARRLPRAAEIGGLVCAVVATVLIATGGDFGTLNMPMAGLVVGLLNAGATAFYTMYPRRLFEKWGSIVTTGLGMIVGGVSTFVIWVVTVVGGMCLGSPGPDLPTLDAVGWLMLVLVVVVGTFGAFGLYLHGVSIVGGARGTQLGAIEPVSATVFTALFLGTTFGWADWAGLVLMVVTIFLVSKQ